MSAHASSSTGGGAGPPSRPARWSPAGTAWGWVLLALVALPLTAIAAIDLAVEARIDARQEIIRTAADPVLAVTTDIQLTLARRMSAIRGYVATGEPRYVRRLQELQEEERAHFTRLTLLAGNVDRTVMARAEELDVATDRWDEAIAVADVAGRAAPPGTPLTRAVLDQQLYDEALDASLRLEDAVREAAARLASEIADLDRTASRISYGLLTLALAAAASIALLGQRTRNLNRDLEQQQLALERVTRSRSRLIRGFSHDLKNPLGAADGHAALLETAIPGPLSELQAESVRRIRATLRTAFHLIEELVELGRVEAGHVEIRPAPVNPDDVLRKVTAEYRPQADAAGLDLTVDVREGRAIYTDPRRVEQIMGNLVSNAIKYTEQGAVRVGARWDGSGPAPGRVHLYVEDTGIGVPPESVEAVFQEFTRLHASQVPGAGLGLAISARIARSLGGELTLESRPGCGSTFTLTLPLEYPGPG